MKQLPIARLPELFAAMAAGRTLYIPADDGGQARFLPYRDGMEMTRALNTVRSAKDLFFPQTENLVGFQVRGREIALEETRDEVEPFVVFGVRACDAASFRILDTVFLAEPADTFYQTRRACGTVVTLACGQPEETCFCTAFGIDPAEPGGDAACWMDREGRAAPRLAAAAGGGRRRRPRQSPGGHPGRCGAAAPGEAGPDGLRRGAPDGEIQPPGLGQAVGVLPGLRHVHLRLSHLPVLRHPGL